MSLHSIINRHPTPTALVLYFAFMALAALLPSGQSATAFGFAVFCLATGVVEEAVFCGALFCLFAKEGAGGGASSDVLVHTPSSTPAGFPGEAPLRAAVFVVVLFGLAHLSLALDLGACVLKVVQAGLFSLCMLFLYRLTKHLWVPMLAHAAFDAWYFFVPWAATGALPPYPAALSPDVNLPLLAGTTLFFALAALIMYRFAFRRKETAL